MPTDEFRLFMRDEHGNMNFAGTVTIFPDLATAIAGLIAFEKKRRVLVFEGSLLRRVVDPPDETLLNDLVAPQSEYGFQLRIRKVKAKGHFGPYSYSPWIEAETFESGREAMDAFLRRKVKRTEEAQVTWCGEPVIGVGDLPDDFMWRDESGRTSWVPRLVMLVKSFGAESQLNYDLWRSRGGTPAFPKGRNMYMQGPRLCPDTLRLLPHDLDSRSFQPAGHGALP